jgi:hypothetical protein
MKTRVPFPVCDRIARLFVCLALLVVLLEEGRFKIKYHIIASSLFFALDSLVHVYASILRTFTTLSKRHLAYESPACTSR